MMAVVYRSIFTLIGLSLAFAAAGCGSGGGAVTTDGTTPTPGTTTNGAGALQGEAASAAAGDIPDNQVFLTFHNASAKYSMKYPEGWAQLGSGGIVTFRDKNNVVRAVVSKGPA